jgi:tetratricopeptide (TPR) repeat protein/transglutaminase-like putative cysteine protease
MIKRLSVLISGVMLAGLSLSAQAPPPLPATSTDYSQEAFVIEQTRTMYRFENDGTGRRETYARVKVQSDAGVQQWGQLVFGFNASTERMDIQFVRVHKADGSTVTAPADAVQELSSPVEREAPIYTDFRQKHITVPSLRPGEILEFSIAVISHTALAANHFWMEHDFHTAAVVLDDRLEVDIPAGRAVTLKTERGLTPAVSEDNGRTIYRWSSSQTKSSSQLAKEAADRKQDDAPTHADIRLTTFQNWGEVGSWYAALEKSSRAPDAALRAKAQELVAGKTTDIDKMEALYDYVALNFRYVSISLGAGRYQPRAAADVLRDQYGDCKDKHTLLASLMESVGLHVATVLINSEEKIDPDFPSPSQFDHVITRADIGGQGVWVDVTSEVAPFRLLSPQLRKHQALVVDKGTGRLEETPADPPMPNSQVRSVEGTLGEVGTLKAKVTYAVRGDLEIPLRTVFRRTPSARWKEVIEQLNMSAGIGGEVGDFTVSDPAMTRQPFTVVYTVTKVGFVDWTKRTASLELPLSSFDLPEQDDEKTPIDLGSPEDSQYRFRLELGDGYAARAPQTVTVARDYGDYKASYAVSGRTFTAERTLHTRTRELAPERAADYAAFRRVVFSDEAQRLVLDVPASSPGAAGGDLKAADLFRSGADALRSRNFAQAVQLLTRVVELEPKHATAWGALGTAHVGAHEMDAAIAAFKKQIEINPFDATAYNTLGAAYMMEERSAEAEAAFKKQLEINPLDQIAPQLLSQLYMRTKRYADALPLLERAASAADAGPDAQLALGNAYLNVGRTDEAVAAFDKVVQASPTPTVWNNVAYFLAEKGTRLERAQQYAESAVTSMSAESRNFTVARLTNREIGVVNALASYWDTLGWVAFMKGDLSKAEQLLTAGWRLSDSGVIGDHLAQTYEKQGRRDLAIKTYAAVLSADRPDAETRERLQRIAPSSQSVDQLVQAHSSDLTAMRTLTVKSTGASGTADFVVLIGAKGVEDVAFVDGDDALRAASAAVRAADYKEFLPVPDAVPAKLLRRGTLACAPGKNGKSECRLTLDPSGAVKSIGQ